nr:hypothetical protein [Candidatus Sigynarchaeota archaeon]
MGNQARQPDIPAWSEVREATDSLRQAMDAMSEQDDFASFRPSVARAIAQARDERKVAEIPAPKVSPVEESREEPDFEVIPVRLTAIDIARIAIGAKNF